jgi:AcrR family transcriptional regulator
MPAARAPRRLPPQDRREQLTVAAQALAARDGYAAFSLEEVAERADVTRNLIYRYFPRGRLDLFLAAIHRGGAELTDGWLTDPQLSIEQRVATNFQRMMAHAAQPSPAWLVHRQARATIEPEIHAALDGYLQRIIIGISLNHLGTSQPPPLARTAISAYLAFAERALDDAREQALPDAPVLHLLAHTLVATIDAASEHC